MAPAAAELSVVGVVATPGRTTETFTWLSTGAYVGGAAGAVTAGMVIKPLGINTTMSLSAAFAVAAAAACSVAVRNRAPTPADRAT
jgi:predicted MFS family arabinose efflux permease